MRTFSFTPIAIASMLLLQASYVSAQKTDEEELSAVYGDKSTVSIATGNTQPLRRAPAVATVITAEDIAAIGAQNLCEIIESVPAFHCSRNSQFYNVNYAVRGIGLGGPVSPQLLFLVNGTANSTMYTGDYQGSPSRDISIQNIARIEIIRGPGSALYGADAYAGVVNIITKASSDTPGTEFGVHLGSEKTRKIWAQYGGKIGKVDIAAYLNYSTTDGPKEIITADAATRNDGIFNTKSSLAPGPVNAGFNSFDLGLDFAYENFRVTLHSNNFKNIGTGAGVSSALDPTKKGESARNMLSVAWNDKNFGENLSVGTKFSYMTTSERFPDGIVLFPPGTKLPTGLFPDGVIGGPNRWERHLRVSGYANYAGIKSHQIRIGLGYDHFDLYKATTFKNFISNANGTPVPNGAVSDLTEIQPHIRPTKRNVKYIYIQDEWEMSKNLVLTAGVRYDKYSDFGSTTNPRLALVWDTTQSLTTKLLFGRAFRAPSFGDTRGINVVANGNPKLAPETISTYEFATSWQATNALQLNLNFFHFQRKNIITTVTNPAPAPGATYQNTGNQKGKGVELEVAWDFSRSLRFTGNYSHQRTIDTKVDKDIGYAPHHHLYGRADWRFANGWALSSQLNWVADRVRAPGDTRKPIADYKTLDLTLRTTRGINQWDFTASVRNIFNTEVKEPSLAPGLALPNDLPLSRRKIYLQAIYKL